MTEPLGEERPAAGSLGLLRSLGGRLLGLRRPWAVAAPTAWAGLIWLGSELTGGPPGGAPVWLRFLGNGMHAFEFGVLALLCLPLLPRREQPSPGGIAPWVELTRWRFLAVLAVAVTYAVVDELHQAKVPGRMPSGFDVLTDGVGAACTLWLASYAGRQGASSAGVRARLGAGVALCAAAALASTLADL